MYGREVDNVLKLPSRRYQLISVGQQYDRPQKKAEWLRMRKIGRLWSRFDTNKEAWPPYEASAYWAWESELKSTRKQPPLRERLSQYKYDKENVNMPF